MCFGDFQRERIKYLAKTKSFSCKLASPEPTTSLPIAWLRFLPFKSHTACNSSIRSDEGLWLEKSGLDTLWWWPICIINSVVKSKLSAISNGCRVRYMPSNLLLVRFCTSVTFTFLRLNPPISKAFYPPRLVQRRLLSLFKKDSTQKYFDARLLYSWRLVQFEV